ncbi:nucleotidyltransferase [Psychrobacillus psychrodurans]|uniref:nucleotidyltransferase n=1 Tax=Psychrobacillus psychrodurans TaxID=126157 RepID=UPI0008E42457|nr:nucleotidyltransferase [Psychrobacillus psychrodurans]MCZ8539428.1 nucleotidyltransferase [Psychrobacillus psychrodurans]SFM38681.1 Predicted nucleotidyltransferase [Psychrobacillus psychrodurans]
MKATGIIVEYNPFHNGHLHHLQQTRIKTNNDIVIAVMSGNFLQRGEPALVDKWTRSKMAIASGVDLVIELPYAFATAQASDFAKGSIFLLDALKCSSFCFGSEEGSLEAFQQTYSLLSTKKDEYNTAIANYIKKGISYPKALNEAYNDISKASTDRLVDLSKPNNILGYHYVQAANLLNSNIKPETIQRVVANFHDDANNNETIASATGIRKLLFEGQKISEVNAFMPSPSLEGLKDWESTYFSFGSWEIFYPTLRILILRSSKEKLAQIAEITEGMENAIWKAAKTNTNFESFMQQIKSKRFTWTRIQRMLTHIYTDFTWDQLRDIDLPTYIRPLAMNKKGQAYLQSIKKELQLPLISRVAASKNDKQLQLDIKAADLYYLGLQSSFGQSMVGSDFRNAPIIQE